MPVTVRQYRSRRYRYRTSRFATLESIFPLEMSRIPSSTEPVWVRTTGLESTVDEDPLTSRIVVNHAPVSLGLAVRNRIPMSGPPPSKSSESNVCRRDLLQLSSCGLGSVVSGCLLPGPSPREPKRDDVETDISDMCHVFSDNFVSDELDHDRWQTQFPWGTRVHNFDAYAAEGNAYVSDETLVLKGEDRSQNGLSYTTGVVSTRESFGAGYFEASIRVPPNEPGFWPAFWLISPESDVIFPEIDIFEFFGRDQCAALTYHYKDSVGEERKKDEEVCDGNFSNDYHEYAVYRGDDRIVWFIDGVERFRYEGSHISGIDMALIINFGIGVDFLDEPNGNYLPTEMLIEQVDVWEDSTDRC